MAKKKVKSIKGTSEMGNLTFGSNKELRGEGVPVLLDLEAGRVVVRADHVHVQLPAKNEMSE